MPAIADALFAHACRQFRTRLGGPAPVLPAMPPLLEHGLAGSGIDYDALFDHFGDRYRAAFLINFSLGFLAVLLALLPLSGLLSDAAMHTLAMPLSIAEVLCVLAILLVHVYGREASANNRRSTRWLKRIGLRKINQGWRRRWVQARLCAEQVRHADLLLGFPGGSLHADTPVYRADDACHARYRRHFLQVLAGQILYHDGVARCYHRIHHRLHRLADRCFYLTLLACLAHLKWHAPWLSALAAALPALAATCHGILASGEYARLAEQSRAMVQSLRALHGQATQQIEPEQLRQQVLAFYQLVMQEASGWKLTLHDKDVQVA